MKQAIYGTTNNLAAQRQRKESTQNVKLGIPPQQRYQNPKHQDWSKRQPCFLLKDCIKPSGNTKHSNKASTGFRAWRKSAKFLKKKARDHLQAKHDIEQYKGNARSASFLIGERGLGHGKPGNGELLNQKNLRFVPRHS